ncbi:MAG: hypothetical protein HND48_21085 [Chloroflexi bacterium]|nr:hypothetical protein [Chloroflexota bacterium]
MLNEPASSIHDRRPQPAADESVAPIPGVSPQLDAVRVAVMQVMAIEAERTPGVPCGRKKTAAARSS